MSFLDCLLIAVGAPVAFFLVAFAIGMGMNLAFKIDEWMGRM